MHRCVAFPPPLACSASPSPPPPWQVNLRGVMLGTKHAARVMKEVKVTGGCRGVIINTASVASFRVNVANGGAAETGPMYIPAGAPLGWDRGGWNGRDVRLPAGFLPRPPMVTSARPTPLSARPPASRLLRFQVRRGGAHQAGGL